MSMKRKHGTYIMIENMNDLTISTDNNNSNKIKFISKNAVTLEGKVTYHTANVLYEYIKRLRNLKD